jgi:predicted lysophospholipase L1 biosynthesis ABC-type transport system permease subunit
MVAVAGVAIGTVLGLLLTRIVASMLNDVNPTDPSVFLANVATVVAAPMAACYVPARAAGRVDPGRVLRND